MREFRPQPTAQIDHPLTRRVVTEHDQQLRELSAAVKKLGDGFTPDGASTTIVGVMDHGELTGLLDDDHPQYLLLAGRSGQVISDKIGINTSSISSTSSLYIKPPDGFKTALRLESAATQVIANMLAYNSSNVPIFTIYANDGIEARTSVSIYNTGGDIGLSSSYDTIRKIDGTGAAPTLTMYGANELDLKSNNNVSTEPHIFISSSTGTKFESLDLPVVVKHHNSGTPTANIMEWQDKTGGSVLASVDKDGVITAAGFSGPVSGTVNESDITRDSAVYGKLSANDTITGKWEFDVTSGSVLTRFNTNGANGYYFAEVADADTSQLLQFVLDGAIGSAATLTVPAAGGTLVTTTNSVTITSKTLSLTNTAQVSTGASGFAFEDFTTANKRLRFILSSFFTGSGFNSHTIQGTTTGVRAWSVADVTGQFVMVGNDPPSVAAGALGKVDLTGQTSAIGSTNLTNTAVAGLYAIEVYAICTTASGSGSPTLDVTLAWTDGLGATSANVVGTNGTTFPLSLSSTGRAQGRVLIQLASGEISYSTTINSSAGTPQYSVYLRVVYLG